MDDSRVRFAAALRGLGAERNKGPADVAEVLGCSRATASVRWNGKREYLAGDLEALLAAWNIGPELLWRRATEANYAAFDEAAAS